MPDSQPNCRSEFEELRDLLDCLDESFDASVNNAAVCLADSLKQGAKILSCGNGGSSADALHLAEELVGRYKGNRQSLPAICLSADVTVLTCIANDYGFNSVYSRAVESLGNPGDCLVGISTSGNSENVIRAMHIARQKGLSTILLSGQTGGHALHLANHPVLVPSQTTARIQEIHTLVIHAWLEWIESRFSPA